jgi:ADP-ribose pyrophosphatase YjhB (NUDIX family)
MASVGPSNYVAVVLLVGGSKASDIKLVLQPERRYGKTWFLAGSVLPNEEHVNPADRELLEEIGLTLTPHDLTLLSNNPVRVPLPEGKYQLVYVFSSFVLVPFVAANIRTHAKLVQAATAQSTINHDGTYIAPATIDIDSLSLTPTKIGLLHAIIRKLELLYFGYVAQRKTFRRAVTTNHMLCHETVSYRDNFFFTFVFQLSTMVICGC